jgi:hypothetical protein
MAKTSRRRRGSFLDNYHLDDPYLLKPERRTGRPGLLTGFDPEGDPVIIKMWQRQSGAQDTDLEEIWHNEVRQLLRLGGYPGAAESIAPLHQAGHDEAGFYLVLKPGQRRPLATLLQHANAGHWLANQRSPSNRARLWRNLRRIVSGLDTLHAQGLLHRNIDRWAILTTGGDEVDFQLTGFEWSLRLVSAAAGNKAPRRSEVEAAGPASFLEDWKGFGLLAADLIGVNLQRLQDRTVTASNISEHLSTDEVRLLRNVTQVEPLQRLDGEVVDLRIADVLLSLEAQIAGRDPKLYLVVRLGIGSRLSEQIREEFDGDIEVSAVGEQIAVVKDDLSGSRLLLGVRSPNGAEFRLLLRGGKLLYNLNPYVYPRTSTAPTWEMAYSDRAERVSPATVNLIDSIPLPPNAIEVLTLRKPPTASVGFAGS